MTLGLFFFIVSILGVSFFLIWKAPLLDTLPERIEPEKSLKTLIKEKINTAGEEVKKRIALNDILQKLLSYLRRFILRVERITIRYLDKLKKKDK